MKKNFLAALGVGIMVSVASAAWAQSVTVNIDFNGPIMDPSNPSQEIPFGSAFMIMLATTGTPMGAVGGNPYFAATEDIVLDIESSFAGSQGNPSVYWDSATLTGYGMGFPFQNYGFSMDLGSAGYEAGDTVSLFIRIFNNVIGNSPAFDIGKPASFDANGNLIQFADGSMPTDYDAWRSTYYFDTTVMNYEIPSGTSASNQVNFSVPAIDPNIINDWSPDGVPNNTWAPVPEPGAMMLMASGLLLIFRRKK